jgi:hypothetical protein
VQSPAARFREASHAWFNRDEWFVDEDGHRPLRGRGVCMPQRMFAENLKRRLGVSLRHASRMLKLLEERTEHLGGYVVKRAGTGGLRGRRYIDRDSLYRLEKFLKYDLLLDAHHEQILHVDQRRGPKGADPVCERRELRDDQAKDDRRSRVDVTIAMAALLGMTERGLQRGDRVDEELFEDVRDECAKDGMLDRDDGDDAEARGDRETRQRSARLRRTYRDTWKGRV